MHTDGEKCVSAAQALLDRTVFMGSGLATLWRPGMTKEFPSRTSFHSASRLAREAVLLSGARALPGSQRRRARE